MILLHTLTRSVLFNPKKWVLLSSFLLMGKLRHREAKQPPRAVAGEWGSRKTWAPEPVHPNYTLFTSVKAGVLPRGHCVLQGTGSLCATGDSWQCLETPSVATTTGGGALASGGGRPGKLLVIPQCTGPTAKTHVAGA